ncbi:MAG: virulence factor SrfC family protein [Candidatus Competibacteraceae bacterium]
MLGWMRCCRARPASSTQTLQGLGADSGDALTLTGSNGATVRLPRSTVAALIAELKIVIQEQPWDFFQHTDLLDFPGARSREQIKDLPGFLSNADALQSLFLRGKVAYLFERYCAEQELTSMLLCIGPSNQEVKSLPEMIYDWIVSTHGATPEQRARQATSLFLVLTKFDMEFEEKAGERSPEARWTTRLESSLLNFFGKQHDWPERWDGQGCFRNSYWIRNPNFKAKHIFDYDEAGHELGIRKSESKRIDAFRAAFLDDTTANRHFREPQQAWDAGFKLNDGGISYLAENLRPLCNPELKREQIAGQLDRLSQQISEHIGHYYVSDNPEQEFTKRVTVSQAVARHLIDCAGAQRFGELLRELQVASDELADIYYRIETRLPEDEGESNAPSIGTAVDKSKMQQLLGLTDAIAEAEPAAALKDDAALFAKEALSEWMQDLQDLAGNGSLSDYYKFPDGMMAEFVKELIAGAQRLQLENRITEAVREATGFRLKFQQLVTLPARLTANLINSYVNFLGYDVVAVDQRPVVALAGSGRPVFQPRTAPRNGPVLEERPSSYDETYYTDWIRGFLDLVERNARFRGGVDVDIEANRQLGELLALLEAQGKRGDERTSDSYFGRHQPAVGVAIITVQGLPGRLETLEFSLSRRGYGDNHLGADGWQGTECWLPPEEGWYKGDALQFVIGPDLVYQLENMPYELALRGEGLAGTIRTPFIWPLELEVEENVGSGREPIGGTRIHPHPRSPEPVATPKTPEVKSEPPESSLPALGSADIAIPDLTIPDYQPPPTASVSSTPPPISPRSEPSVREPVIEPPPLPASVTAEPPPAVEEPPPLPTMATPSPVEPLSSRREQISEPPTPEPPAIDTTPPKRTGLMFGVVAGLGLLLLGGAAGWWWLNQSNEDFAIPHSEIPTPVSEIAQPATESTSPAESIPAQESETTATSESPVPSQPTPVNAPEPKEAETQPEPPVVEAEPVVVREPSPEPAPETPPEPVSPPPVTSIPEFAPAAQTPPATAVQPERPAVTPSKPASGADLAAELEKQLQQKSDLEADLESQLKQQPKADLDKELESTFQRKP